MSHEPSVRLPHLPLCQQFSTLLEEVGNQILVQYQEADHSVVYKTDNSPQTIADRYSHAHVTAFLQRNSFAPVFSEESANNAGFTADTFWTLDPLDGTQDFLNRTGEFSIMISLVEAGWPVFGVVYQPVSGRVYVAEKGKGAFVVERNGRASQLHVSEINQFSDVRMVVSRSHGQKTDLEIARVLGISHVIPHGSFGLKVGLIARGEAELLVYPPRVTSVWDSTPSIVILSEAGGTITDLEGTPLSVDPSTPRNMKGVIATNGRNHPQALEAVRTILGLP